MYAVTYYLPTGAITTFIRGLALAAIIVCVFVLTATVAPVILAAVAAALAVVAHVAGIIAAMVAHAAAFALALVVRVAVLYAAVKLTSAARRVNWDAVGAVVKPLTIGLAFVVVMVLVFAWAPVVCAACWVGCCSLAATLAGVVYNVAVCAAAMAVPFAVMKVI